MIYILITWQLLTSAAIFILIRLYWRAAGIQNLPDFMDNLRMGIVPRLDDSFYPTVEDIQAEVCIQLKINRADITSKSRKRTIVEARQIAQHLCYLYCNRKREPLAKIAFYFNCDHSTILYSNGVIEDLVDVYPELKNKIEKIKDNLFVRLKAKQ